jgi:hypothetical protein
MQPCGPDGVGCIAAPLLRPFADCSGAAMNHPPTTAIPLRAHIVPPEPTLPPPPPPELPTGVPPIGDPLPPPPAPAPVPG